MKKISLFVIALAALLVSCAAPKKLVNLDEATMVYKSQSWNLIRIDENNYIAIPGPYATPGPVPFVISFDSVVSEEIEDGDECECCEDDDECCGEDDADGETETAEG